MAALADAGRKPESVVRSAGEVDARGFGADASAPCRNASGMAWSVLRKTIDPTGDAPGDRRSVDAHGGFEVNAKRLDQRRVIKFKSVGVAELAS